MDIPPPSAEVGWFQGPCRLEIVSLCFFRFNRGPDICSLTSKLTTLCFQGFRRQKHHL